MKWWALFRGGSREIEEMLAAWTSEQACQQQLAKPVKWDAVRSPSWDLVCFPRSVSVVEDIDYHDVLKDLDASTPMLVRTIERD